MHDQRVASDILARWRDIDRDLKRVDADSAEADSRRTEAARLYDEYERLAVDARLAGRRGPPPFPGHGHLANAKPLSSSVPFWVSVVATAAASLAYLLSARGFDLAQEFAAVLGVGGLGAIVLWSRNRAIAAGILCGILAATAISLLLVAFVVMNSGALFM